VLDRSQDGARAATLAEYRNRHSVYQFTEAGYRAHRAVESVLAAGLDDSTLSRLVFADLLADLQALAKANADGDAEEVYRKLNRLDRALADVAERAARFYHMLGDLSRTHDVRPEVFLSHKDALLAHLRDFHDELQRYTPRLREAVHEVEDTGLERMIEAAAEADERLFATPVERLEDWRRRWRGLRSWLAPENDVLSEADRLSGATMAAIGDVLALLRRVAEARRGGLSRESQLRHLAAWFTGAGSAEAAHAVFDVVFGLGAPRHVGVAYPDLRRGSRHPLLGRRTPLRLRLRRRRRVVQPLLAGTAGGRPGLRLHPQIGYVAVGTVTGPATPFDEALITVDGEPRKMTELGLAAGYRHPGSGPDQPEYIVPVDWIKTLDQGSAVREKGLFANQHSACKLRNSFTLRTLAQRFGLDQ
jgi:hypothetical protein